jgi:hypothetical protein
VESTSLPISQHCPRTNSLHCPTFKIEVSIADIYGLVQWGLTGRTTIQGLAEASAPPAQRPGSRLTRKEAVDPKVKQEIYEMIAAGMDTDSISAKTGVAPKVVGSMVYHQRRNAVAPHTPKRKR